MLPVTSTDRKPHFLRMTSIWLISLSVSYPQNFERPVYITQNYLFICWFWIDTKLSDTLLKLFREAYHGFWLIIKYNLRTFFHRISIYFFLPFQILADLCKLIQFSNLYMKQKITMYHNSSSLTNPELSKGKYEQEGNPHFLRMTSIWLISLSVNCARKFCKASLLNPELVYLFVDFG